MENINTLKADLSAIGDAIREKLAVEDKYKIENMPAAIRGISGGADPVIETLEITENGTYQASEGVDGYSPIVVNVPQTGEDRLPALLSNTLSGEVTVKDITSVKDYGFYSCTEITKVNLPNVITIGSNVFYGDRQLSELNIPNLKKMGGNNFYNCVNITKLLIENLEEITSNNNFGYCNKLKTLEFPKLSKSDGYMLRNSNVRNLGLPAVINSGTDSSSWNYRTLYGNTYFECLGIRDCTSLPSTSTTYSLCTNTSTTNWTKFIVDNETPPTLASIIGTFNTQANADRLTVYVPKNAVAAYEAATNWSSMNIAAIEDSDEQLIGIFNWIDEKYFSGEMTLLERWNKFLSSENFAYLGWTRLKEISDNLKINRENSEFYPGAANIVGKSFVWNDMTYTFIDTFVDLDENGNVIPFTISITLNEWFLGNKLSIDDGAPMVSGYNNTKGGWEFTDMRKSFNGDSTTISTWSALGATDEMINSITPHQKKYIYCSNSGTVGGNTEERICIDIMSLFSSKQIYGEGISASFRTNLQTDIQYKLFKDRGITSSNYSDLTAGIGNNSWLSDIAASSYDKNFCRINYDGGIDYYFASISLGRFMYITV